MNRVLETIRAICDKDGNFYFDELRQSGLSRVEVRQAIVLLNKAGHTILNMRSEAGYWQYQNIYWARKEMARQAMSR
jgi:hypothetical protein